MRRFHYQNHCQVQTLLVLLPIFCLFQIGINRKNKNYTFYKKLAKVKATQLQRQSLLLSFERYSFVSIEKYILITLISEHEKSIAMIDAF
jgi:hypothetical protein